ncbi:MAG: YbjQ family protein [Ignavibacteria bacterium]|nr:YbjQ family protein [Ignavibacteria bacterium]
MDHTLITTAFEIDGYKIVKNLGIIRGITVRSRNMFATIGASLQTIIGGNITLFTELCEKTRGEAFELMVQHAEEIGANGIIGMRYDANEVMSGVTEVLAYGTAVIMEKE